MTSDIGTGLEAVPLVRLRLRFHPGVGWFAAFWLGRSKGLVEEDVFSQNHIGGYHIHCPFDDILQFSEYFPAKNIDTAFPGQFR